MPAPYLPTHLGFSDESNWNQGQYRSLCLVTLEAAFAPVISEQVRAAVDKCGAQEFAWKDVRTRNREALAHELCEIAIDRVCDEEMRIDVLIWDTHDSRHRVHGRDDTGNLARMYYKGMKTVIGLRWPSGSRWEMRVDQRADIDWGVLRRCVFYGVRKAKRTRQLDLDRQIESKTDNVEVVQVRSLNEPLVQIADLFAGLGAFSWNRAKPYWRWRQGQAGQANMFLEAKEAALSNSEAHKAGTLSHLRKLIGRQDLGISHWPPKGKGLRTKDPSNLANFWFYRPQHAHDKAPTHRK